MTPRSNICAVVPVKETSHAKQRLAGILPAAARQQLALAMIEDVLDALARVAELAGILVVTVDPAATALATRYGAQITRDGACAGHTGAVMAAARALASQGLAMLALPGDIPLLTSGDVRDLLAVHQDSPAFTIVPARDFQGSNAVIASPADAVPLRFGENSFYPHLAAAEAQGIKPLIMRRVSIELDIDSPDDLAAFARIPSPTRAYRLLARWRADDNHLLRAGTSE